MAKLAIEYVPISQIKPYENNARHNDGEATEKVAASIKAFGFQQPILVDDNNVIITGHTRLKAALSLGMDKIPIAHAVNLTEEQVRDSLKKQGISYKEYSSSKLKKRDREYAAYRKEVNRRKSTHALLNTGTTNRHGKAVKHRALSSGEDFNLTFSQWRANKK